MQPTESRYNLKCKVLVKEVSYLDEQSKGASRISEKFVYLIPQESTQRDLFFAAWLPDTREEKYELGFTCGHPVSGFARGCIRRRNAEIGDHHIFVMSKGAEEDIKDWIQHVGGPAMLNIEVLGEQEEELMDMIKDYSLRDKKEFDNPFAEQGK
jgi:hypothetical protein